ncbi:MAG: hypothetical protein LBB47_00975 [Spirochaetaceae bacterium]|jgi:mRNA-degrading endonuclease RelE of RelBE toxin-antitoxin system|nr:hypothetical protein [Spirochaetaceae bacterium]
MNKIAITYDFLEAFARLPRPVQNKVKKLLKNIAQDEKPAGLNFEKINRGADKHLYSARVDLSYRVIVYMQDSNDRCYYLLWIDHHDEAYEWAINKEITNIDEGNMIVINTDSKTVDGSVGNIPDDLFKKIPTEDLLALSVPQQYLLLVRNINHIDSLYQLKDILTVDVYSNIEWLAMDTHIQLIIDENKRTKKDVLDFIKKEVLYPAISHPLLKDEIKNSVKDTLVRLEIKESVNEISDFFEDALMSLRGKEIYKAFHDLGLKGFEDITDDVRKLCDL